MAHRKASAIEMPGPTLSECRSEKEEGREDNSRRHCLWFPVLFVCQRDKLQTPCAAAFTGRHNHPRWYCFLPFISEGPSNNESPASFLSNRRDSHPVV